MRLLRLTLIAVALCLAMGALASAQTTGSISGYVFDKDGTAMTGVVVRLTGAQLPQGRTMTTAEDGSYRFLLLPPGAYDIEILKDGAATAKRAVRVEVGKDTQVDLVSGMEVREELTVTASLPVVDTKSSEVNFNYKKDSIEALPLERSYTGLIQLVPGVADNNSSTIGVNAGGSRQDNTYLLDGVNITNPLFGYLSTEVNEYDIVEFNVKRGAITAEFGRATGMVTNAVSRAGTNRLAGGIRFELIPKAWIAESKSGLKNSTDRWVPAFGVGGPLIRDKIFFYGSGRLARSNTTDRVNNVGPVPDAKTSTNELFGKLTAAPVPNQFFVVSYRHRPSETKFGGVGVNDSPEVATDTEGTNRVVTAEWNWFVGNRTTFDIKYLRLDEQSESVARTQLGFQPTFNVSNLAAMGRFRDPATGFGVGGDDLALERINYGRNEVRARLSQYLDLGPTAHLVKAGFGYEDGFEDLTRNANGWGNIAYVQNNTRIQAVYYPTQPSQLSRARTYSLFVQDDITIGERVVVNAGVLFNRDEFAQDFGERRTFLQFDFGDEIQPRLGFNYRLRKDAGDKIYGNWGRYYALEQKSSARALATQRLFTEEALFDLNGNLISRQPAANTVAKTLDPGLEPPYTDEVLFGYATPIAGLWSIDAFFQYRDAKRFIEDIPTVLPNSAYVYKNDPDAKRRYRALTIELNRRMANRWSASFSYSLSKLYGNYDQDYSVGAAVFNTSSLINDGPGSFTADTFRQGVLSQDRTHVFKIFGSYMPLDALTLGTYIRGQSGTPWEARGLPWGSTATYLRYLEPAGTNRNDFWTNVDLLAAYSIPLGRARFKVEGRVLNLFDTQTALTVDQRKYLDGRIRTIIGTPPAGCLACWTDAMVQGTTTPNPSFGRPTTYAPARRFLLSLIADF